MEINENGYVQFFVGFGTLLLMLSVLAIATYFFAPQIFAGIVDALSKIASAVRG